MTIFSAYFKENISFFNFLGLKKFFLTFLVEFYKIRSAATDLFKKNGNTFHINSILK